MVSESSLAVELDDGAEDEPNEDVEPKELVPKAKGAEGVLEAELVPKAKGAEVLEAAFPKANMGAAGVEDVPKENGGAARAGALGVELDDAAPVSHEEWSTSSMPN